MKTANDNKIKESSPSSATTCSAAMMTDNQAIAYTVFGFIAIGLLWWFDWRLGLAYLAHHTKGCIQNPPFWKRQNAEFRNAASGAPGLDGGVQ